MNTEKQRIAIAEACGFHDFRTFGRRGLVARNPDSETFCGIPRYLTDLNAMHEAEKVLTEGERENFSTHLWTIVEPNEPGVSLLSATWIGVSATAAQRAEAFLRCLGKWEDS